MRESFTFSQPSFNVFHFPRLIEVQKCYMIFDNMFEICHYQEENPVIHSL